MARYYEYHELFQPGLMAWFFVFQGLAIVMFGSLFLAVGACCNDLREAQNLVLPIWLVLVIPLLCPGTILEHPHSDFAVALSLFPPATPMLMVVRMAIPPAIPLRQPLAGIAAVLATTVACVWAAGRIFRVGLLLQGKAPPLAELVRWAVRG